MIGTLVFFGIVILLGVIVAGIFNRLVALRNRYRNAFSQIEVKQAWYFRTMPTRIYTQQWD